MKDVSIKLKDKSFSIICSNEFTDKMVEHNTSLNQVFEVLRSEEDELLKMNAGEEIFVIGEAFAVEVEKYDTELKLIRFIPSDNILM